MHPWAGKSLQSTPGEGSSLFVLRRKLQNLAMDHCEMVHIRIVSCSDGSLLK